MIWWNKVRATAFCQAISEIIYSDKSEENSFKTSFKTIYQSIPLYKICDLISLLAKHPNHPIQDNKIFHCYGNGKCLSMTISVCMPTWLVIIAMGSH